MSATPRTSIIVPTRGGRERLPTLLAHLAAQNDPDFEVIVVVDGDIDGSADFLADLPADLRHLNLNTIVFSENQGRSRALNAGFESARGDILVRCDDDLEPAPDYVSLRVAHHANGPVGVVGMYRNIIADNAYSQAYGRDADNNLRAMAQAAAPQDRWHFWQGNVSVDRASYEKVGPYDDVTFRAYGWEDVDWGYRLLQAGIPIVLDPELETVHRAAADTTARRAQRAFYSGAAGRRFAIKHGLPEPDQDAAPGPAVRVWNLAVNGTAKMLNEHRVDQLGRGLDKALPRLPKPLGQKLVSLLVESAFTSGKKDPDSVGSKI